MSFLKNRWAILAMLARARLGAFVTSINDVVQGQSFYWMWWLWNGTEIQWLNKWISASEYKVANGEIFLWHYGDGEKGSS